MRVSSELAKVADIICSLFNSEELESLTIEDRKSRHFSFREQIIITYYNRNLKVEPSKVEGIVKDVMSIVKPISDLRKDNEGYEVNRKLLEIFERALFI